MDKKKHKYMVVLDHPYGEKMIEATDVNTTDVMVFMDGTTDNDEITGLFFSSKVIGYYMVE